eukprot:CAMPEP_0167759682 /NCGR_PEP_ID=MMETSP0110_2-20121227/11157_1 /TAXON_ID=629695 /ORGANISM="Gymnochlora sp., Strain CCMP2014" /LENGTH=504 /DNA_ID=CAMNT_0007646091 /DNA_START=39 /DNA_END=1550 /DNA_ORIENTATION=+
MAPSRLIRMINIRSTPGHVGHRMCEKPRMMLPKARIDGLPGFLPSPSVESVQDTVSWMQDNSGLKQNIESKDIEGRTTFVASRDIPKGTPILQIPSSKCITRNDVDQDPILSKITEGQDTITALALWIVKQRALGQDSEWAQYMKILPLFTYSPITWSQGERDIYLKGTFVLPEARRRVDALEQIWINIAKRIVENDEDFAGIREGFNLQSFIDAFSVVLAHSVPLKSAENQLALVPLSEIVPRVPLAILPSSSDNDQDKQVTDIDYNTEIDAVVLTSSKDIKAGDEIYLTEDFALSNAELLLTRGQARSGNSEDFIAIDANIVMADVLYSAKKQILDAYGMGENQKFIVYKDRLPLELLSYLRLSRLQSSNDLLKLNFEQDSVVSEMNEYEILQLLLSEARSISGGYASPDTDSDRFILKEQDSSVPQKLAAVVRLGEKEVVSGFMDMVRTRLAPIRGIPTKQGMEDKNQEILDMFDTFEAIPKAPQKFVKSITDWWTDERNW